MFLAVKWRKFLALMLGILVVSGVAGTGVVLAATTWDNLEKVKSKRLDEVYLLPGADFKPYTKIMLDPTEVAFTKNWQKDYNSAARGSSRITDDDVRSMLAEARNGVYDLFAKELSTGGYALVTEPGPDVLRLRTSVINLSIVAPDTMSAGRSRTYSKEAGTATLVIEARDSDTGAILGRVIDRRTLGDSSYMQSRTSVSNRSDFAQVVRSWAKATVKGLDALRALAS